jgi:hypothetical protein
VATEKMSMETELEHLTKNKAVLDRIELELEEMRGWCEKNDNLMMTSMAGVIRDLDEAISEVESAGWEVEDAIEELKEEMQELEDLKKESEDDDEPTD